MKIVEFVSYLQNLGVKLWIDKDRLGYRSPKGVMTGELKRNLVERKTEVLEFLREVQTTQESVASFIIRPVSRSGDLLLSYPQELMFFWHQLLPENPLYNVPMILQFEGLLNVTVLEQSLNEIIRRHENLRTSFPSIDGKPIQVISTVANINLSTVELPSSPEKTTQLTQLARTEVEKPFDLAKGPLLRVTLVKLKPEIHILMLIMHHIICDAWSLSLLASELCTLYEAYSQGNPSPLSELPIQYADYAHWQRQQLTTEVLEKHLNYWKQKLAGISPILPLPTDRPRPEVQSFQGEAKKFQLNQNLTQKLTQLGQELGTTLFITLLSAFFILLYRYSGESDLIIGSPTANRNRAEVEPLIGMLANILAIRSQCSDNSSFTELLIQVKQTAQEAYKYQDLPFEKLVGELLPERNLSYNPIVQVMLDFLNFKGGVDRAWDLPGLRVTQDVNLMSNVRMDLEICLWKAQSGSGLEGYFVYNTDLFDRATITRMMEHFQTLVKAIVTNPEQKISKLPLISVTEQQKLLYEWSQTNTDYPIDQCIHQLFEGIVEKNPDAVALIFEEQQLSYSQLNQKANQLAHHILSLGITPETPIGIYLDPTVERIIGVLAILKAGGAYQAIEPKDSSEDVKSISVILTQNHLKSKIPNSNAKILCLDTDWESIAKQNTDNPNIATTATTRAYILNQTLVEHQAIAQRLQWLQETLSITNQEILLHKTSLTQEVALLEIGLPLISGGTIVIATNDNPTELQKLINQHKVTIVHLYPSELPTWLNTTNPETSLKSLHTLLCSGETLSTELADKFLQRYPVKLHNFYSVPEAAGEITHWSWSEKPTTENLPIGQPGRLSVYLLDKHQNPVPKGIPGEIYVGGSSLARSYLHQQQKTSLEFIQHPQLGRLFRTGEIGRYHNKGYLEIVGSKQRQTWLKGKRVQLADIETALLSIPEVEQAYVLAHQNLLVAYVVMTGVWNPKQLHSQIQQQLPQDMIPGAYVPLSSLPLTEKGKVDQVALARFPVIDNNVVQRWQTQLKALPEIEKVAVVVQQKTRKLPPLHISDLLPSDLDLGDKQLTDLVTPPTNPSPQPEDSDSKTPALSDGGLLILPEDAPKTLTEALIQTATQFKERQIIYVLAQGKTEFQTYPTLLEEAKSILSGLYQMGLTAGSKAILQIQSLRDYFPILWACILGGIKPVTVAVASQYEETNAVVKKLYNTWELLEQPPILASDSLIEQLDSLKNFLPMSNLKVLSVNGLHNYPPTAEIHQSHPDDVAFFQLTSGSTGAPKCIQETHKGIIAHIHAAQQFNGFSDSDICLNWLPVDHVVPILTTHMRDVYLGCQQIEVATPVILANPLTWLDLIEKYRVTQSWAPNFGFKLVSDSLLKVPGKSWDLSSIKFLMNAGEQVTLPVVREFLNLVAPYGIKPQAMQPAYGMAEVCTAITYKNQFTLETGVHRVQKSSLGGKLQITQDDDRDTIDFIDVGKAVPGVQIRVTNQNNQVIPEEVIGRLQIKGAVVTPGYLNNTTANQEAFVGNGWFNTGDLGFIIDGSLIVTGREKEQIVINGVNYYCYEIEEIVNQIEGVEPTYVGACGLASGEKGTEKLAIFFTPQNSGGEIDIELIKKIKGQVSASIGINADYVIPLERLDFPKTTSGKIQRSLMKKMFVKGDFDKLIKEIDVKEENSNTIPDWFYQKTWRRKQGNNQLHKLAKDEVILVFIDKLGLGKKLCQLLEKKSQPYVQIEQGETFKKINDNHYIIAPDVQEHYQKLYQCLGAENLQIGAIIHLWHYDKYTGTGEITDTETLETAQKTGIYSLLFILQTFNNHQEHPVRLLYIANNSQSLNPKEAIAYEKATVPGLLKTIPMENPQWHCRHLNLPQESLEVNSNWILEELTIDAKDSAVAYRDGERWVSGIEKINLPSLPKQPLPFKTGGTYLISGGLGGIGVEIAAYLLEHYQAKLLLLGRTALPDRDSWSTYLEQGGKLAEKIKAYQQLQKLSGEVIYLGVDICNQKAVQEVVQQTLSGWNTQQLDGVIHLAGLMQERLLMQETPESLAQVLQPKLIGTWVLHQLQQLQPKSLFINFSSINGFFGGTTVGAYAAANSFLDAFCDYQRNQSQLQSYCLAWSMWDEMGMSRGYQMKQLTQAKGYLAVGLSQGMSSLLAGLCHNQPYLMVGLDSGNVNIRRLTTVSDSLEQLTAYFTTNGKGKPNVSFLEPQVQDAVGKPSSCAVVELPQIPLTEGGDIDLALLRESNLASSVSTEYVAPETEIQKLLAEIWKEVLGIEKVGIHDNFFELGGHSLIATQLISRIRQSLEQDVPLKILFESPTIAKLERVLLKSPEMKDSLDYESDVPLPSIVPAPEQRYQPFPLTEVQQAYWIGRNSAFELGNVATHVYMEFDCENLNIELLSRALQQVIEHHDMLRAIILPDGQQQVLKQVPPYQIEVLDLREQSSEAVTTKLEAIRNQLSHEILSADQWPLFKIRATRLDEKLYRLHWSFDALLADAWSMSTFCKQWLQLYQNPETILPKVELSFRDYIMAELSLKKTPQYRRSQQYWLNRLDTLPPTPELPLVKTLSTLKQPQFISKSALLSKTNWQQLKQRAKRANLTPSGVLLAAFADLLTYWSKSPKFTINLTLFNRLPLHPQVNEIVGDFTSLTLLEVNNSAAIPFQERAQRIQGQLWEDLDHRYVGGVEVQRELRRHRGSYQPMGVIFTSTLALDSLNDETSDDQLEAFPLQQLGESVYMVAKTPQVWFDHAVVEEEGALMLIWNVVEELFPEGMIEEMFNSYHNWLQQLATSDEAWSQTHPQLLPPAQLTQRIQVNQTTAPISEETLHSLFVKQVQQQREADAIITPEYTLTYQELYTKAHKIGQKLRQLGATPNTLVAVLMTKGWEQVAAVLGILMSGAAYLPIDPTFPEERQWHLLELGEVKLALTQAHLAGSLSLPEHIQCLSVDAEEWETIEVTPLDSVQSISDLAYVIFTSGSTGTPKGVMIDHRGAVNTILDINQRFDVKPNDRVLAVSALNFDLSVYDIFGVLAAGGTIVMPSPDGAKDPAHWVELMAKHQVTFWNTVPALMQMLVEYLSQRPDCSSFPLRLVLLSGDWIPLNLPEQIKTFWSQAQVMSLGGATEASIWSVNYPITTVDPEWKSIPYGKPLANQRLYVLNERMEPCPNWVSGQLYIGGIGIAQGYWRNEEKTNASFIIHPHTGEKLYKTGDLARYLPNENIEFLGREDFQVKINGYRIELGEIEATLKQYSNMKEVVLNAVGEDPQKEQLVAYVVFNKESISAQKARDYQASKQEGVLTDPVERLEFKLKQPGVERLESYIDTIELPKDEVDENLTQKYLQRQSYRQFLSQPLSLKQLSKFLSCLQQMKLDDYSLPKYRYPSAGSLYPVQTYLWIKPNRVEGLAAGLYYYHPAEHRLILLASTGEIDGQIYGGNQPIFAQSAFSIFLIGKLTAIAPMYGEFAKDFCLLEAGHIGQLLMSNAPEQEIGLCPIGNLEFKELRDLLKLESSQVLLYSFVGGKIDLAQTKQWFEESAIAKEKPKSEQLREYLRQKLPEYMMPSEFMVLSELPLTPNGKIDRKRLPTPDIKFIPTTYNYVRPRNSQELQLVEIWEDILSFEPVGACSNFFDLGGNSLLAVRLMNRIEQELGLSLPLSTLFQSSTVEQLARILREEQVISDPSPLVAIQPKGSQLPVFCVHPSGGTVFCYFELAQLLGTEQPFYGLQSLGQVEGEEPLTSVEDMAAVYQKAIREVQPKSPYILIGWSFGGMVALEIANNLLAQGEQVAFLGLIDTCAPSQMPDEEQLSENVEFVLELFGGNLSLPWEEIRQLSQEEQVTLIWEQARQANLVPPDFEATQLKRLLHIMTLNHKAMRSYSPPAYPDMITLFRAEAGSVAVSQELAIDENLGWQDVAKAGIEVYTIPGYHEYMVHQPNVAILADQLKSCIAKSLSKY